MNIQKIIKRLFYCLCFVLGLYLSGNPKNSYAINAIDNNNDSIGFADSIIPTVSYKTDIQPAWDMYCVSCHNEFASDAPINLEECCSYEELMQGNKYINFATPERSRLLHLLYGRSVSMPPAPAPQLPDSIKNILLIWINAGAPNN